MILNRQRRIRIPMEELRGFLARAQKQLQLPAGSLTVCLVTDAQIARWNHSYRGKPGPTDVLSFPMRAKPSGPLGQRPSLATRRSPSRLYLGDIAIAPAVARANAHRWGRKFEDELQILILHGMLHLMGYDHESDTGQMDRRERRLRRTLALA
jgi:probable rRNA maturation factor